MVFDELPEFKKDLKLLLKRYKTLEEDLDVLKKIITIYPDEKYPFSFRIADLGIETCILKVKKIACKSMKGKGVNSGLRLVYAFYPEKLRVVFIEIYYKGDKEIENRERIVRNFK